MKRRARHGYGPGAHSVPDGAEAARQRGPWEQDAPDLLPEDFEEANNDAHQRGAGPIQTFAELVAAATTSSDEGTRRAASQALTAAGASSDSDNEASTQHVLVRLLGLLEGGIAGLAVPSSPQLHIDRAANVMVTVVHAIAQLTHWCENCTVVLVI